MNIAGLKFDDDYNPIEPVVILATRSGRKIGVIQKTDFRCKGNLSSADEISFSVYKNAVDDAIWNGLKDFRLCWIQDWDAYFEITVTLEGSDALVKNITGVSLGEAELSQTNLYGVEINTENEIKNDPDYSPTVFFNEDDEERSLMHRLLKRTCYKPGYVEESLMKEQRTFSFNNTSIKDGFDAVAKELKCLFIYRNDTDKETGKINRIVDAYNLDEERKRSNGTPAPVYGSDTGIFISDENIAKKITLTTNTGNVKNCFKLDGGDDIMTAAIASCNPTGTSYLWYFTDDMKESMSDELRTALNSYEDLYRKITENEIIIANGSFFENAVYILYNGIIRDLAGEKYSASEAYSVGDRVNKDGAAYRCKENVSAGETWDNSKWEYVYGEHNAIFTEINSKEIPGYNYTVTTRYGVGDKVFVKPYPTRPWQFNIYECIADFCYDDIPDPKQENTPANFSDYWARREDLEFNTYITYSIIKYAYAENFAQLSEYLYNAIDVRMFLSDAMLPDYNISEMNQDCVDDNMDAVKDWFDSNIVGVLPESIQSVTAVTAANAAEGMIKLIIDPRLRIEISGLTLENEVDDSTIDIQYEGTLTLSGVDVDGRDVSATDTIRIAINDDYAQYVKQKADKALANKTENADRDALNELAKYKGVYDAEVSYAKDDIVWYDGGFYQCISVSGVAGKPAPDDDNINWQHVINNYKGGYSSAKSYLKNDVVSSAGSESGVSYLYKCINENGVTGGSAPKDDSTNWELIDSGYIGKYSAENGYSEDDIVSVEEKTYKCINVNGVSGKPTPKNDNVNWSYFDARLRLYSIAELKNLYDCCDGCLAVLVEKGADGTSATSINEYYDKYYAIMQAILIQGNWRASQLLSVDMFVKYLRSRINVIHNELNMESVLGDTNMNELISYRRETTYSNNNFISDGLTNHELTKRAALFFDDAVKEIYKSAEQQHSISSDIYNLLAIKEFGSVRNQFALGNWIREKLDGVVYKLRLIGYELNFADLSSLRVEFSDLVKAGDSVSDVKSILDKARSVSSTYGYTARQADRGSKAKDELTDINKNGINVSDVTLFGYNKSIQWTKGGFILREYDDITDTYSPNQLKILANGIYSTTDNWKTVTKLV